MGGVGHRQALHAGDDRTAGPTRMSRPPTTCSARCSAAGSPAPVLLHGLDESCWPLLEHAGVRGRADTHRHGGHAAAARRLDGAGQCRAGVGGGARCSVGRGGQREVGEVESGHHDAADQCGLVVARAGTLPVSGRNEQAAAARRRDVAAEQKRCRHSSCSAPTSQQQRAAAVVEPQFGAAHGVPRRLLTGHQQEQDRGSGAARTGVVRRQRGLADRQSLRQVSRNQPPSG